jgi:peptidyl-dipeptidase Dcp
LISVFISGCTQRPEIDKSNPFFTEFNTPFGVPAFEKNYLGNIDLITEIEPRYKSTYFLHIVEGYDAGYYCYTWAAVIDNDAYEAFKGKGIFDKATAESFRRNILGPMGITDAKQSYFSFRGREPVIEPLLKNRGLMQ